MHRELLEHFENSKFNVVVLNNLMKSYVPSLIKKAIGIQNVQVCHFDDLTDDMLIEGAIFIVDSDKSNKRVLESSFIKQNNIAVLRYDNRKLKLSKGGLIFKSNASIEEAQNFHYYCSESDFDETYPDFNQKFFKLLSLRKTENVAKVSYKIAPC
tara:strand:- start:1998 stop:2462 length:465 start_codon:yes stop_codon:yes gene_type:complete